MTRRERWLPLGVLAVAVYVPLLLTEPGRVGADTKTYLYLDPSRLLSRAWSMWDPSIGLGTVSHQNLGYLWPMGPWYWALEQVGAPDWVAQRLWLGSILFAAGAGALWLLRRVLGWSTAPAVAAAFVYALTPYVLTLGARISVILLPFAGLPWLIGTAALALRDPKRWRWPAAFALVVTTVGSVNATALVLAGLGPVLWLAYARVAGEATTRAVLQAALRIGVLTVAVNLWWIAGLWAQGGYGIEILRYTETAEVVASAAVAAEVLRGLGYWFFYGGDRLGPWIEPGAQYTQRLPLLGLTYAIPLAAFLAGAIVRWRERTYFVALLAVGVLAAVGAHPWDDPPPGGEVLKAFLGSDVGLAMRSLPRAAPLVVLALAALLGAGVGALATRWRWPAAVSVALAAYLALPPLWTGGMVASNLDRDEQLPAYWVEAAAALDDEGGATRVLAVPGADFASYRWGNTVDPILPGLVDRPYVARELIPYGSPASADLLGALDRQLQEDVLAPGALGALARLLGVGDVLHRGDLQFERFRTPRPYDLSPRLRSEPGLGEPVGYGTPVVNEPVTAVPLVDELALLADDRRPRPPVEVYPVTDAVAIVRAEGAGGGIVLAGDGEGLVDAAGAGLIGGDELLRYGASLGRDGVAAALDDGAVLVVTDGNRRQGRRWSTVRDTLGYVEPPAALERDLADNRLSVFPDAEPGWETTSASPVRAAATTYGNPTSFTPEYRPANAVDGDLRTEWRTGANRDVSGERLELTFDPPVEASSMTLVQQLSGARNRHVAEIDVRVNGGDARRVALGEPSLTSEGQQVELDASAPIETLSIEIVADSTGRSPSWGRPLRYTGASQVGFAEVRVAGAGGPEALRLPPAATGSIDDSSPVALVLTRWRTDAAEALRDDPEPALRRAWSQPVARTFELSGTVRPSPRAPDETLDAALGTSGATVTTSSRLPGAVSERASAAFDGDATTWWSPRFGDPEPALTYTAPAPVTIDRVDVAVLDDGRRSVPTAIRIEADGEPIATVAPGATVLEAPVTATSFRFVVEAVDEHRFVDWYSNAPVATPPAILEIDAPGLAVDRPEALAGGCRDDLVVLDGTPVPVEIVGEELRGCGPVEVGAGEHLLATPAGRDTGIDVDQLVLASGDVVPVDGDAPDVTVVDQGRPSVRMQIDGATPGEPFWLVLGQSYNEGWELDGRAPELVNGYSAGWLVTPGAGSFQLEAVWKPQRVVDIALAVSAVAAVVCLGLLLTRSLSDDRRIASSRRQRTPGWMVPTAAGLGALVWIGPVSALVVGAFAVAYPRWPGVLRFGPALAFAAAAGYVLARQAIARPGAAFEWPAELATAHEPALVAVALLAVVAATPTRRGDDAPACAPSVAASP